MLVIIVYPIVLLVVCFIQQPNISYSTSQANLLEIERLAVQDFIKMHRDITVEIIHDNMFNDELQGNAECHILKFSRESNGSILILHGANSGPVNFMDIVPMLIDQGLTVYCVAIPGFGEAVIDVKILSKKSHEIANVFDEFIHRIITKYCGKTHKVSLIGHSYGGFLVGHFASKYPEMVEKLILINAAGIFPTLDSVGMYWAVIFKTGFPNCLTRRIGLFLNPLLFSFITTNKELWIMAKMTCQSNIGNEIVSKFITYNFTSAYWNIAMLEGLLKHTFNTNLYLIWGHDDNISPLHCAIMFAALHKAVHNYEHVSLFVIKNGWHNPFVVNNGANMAYVLRNIFSNNSGTGANSHENNINQTPNNQMPYDDLFSKYGKSSFSIIRTISNINNIYHALAQHFNIYSYSIKLKVAGVDAHDEIHIQNRIEFHEFENLM